MVSLTRSNSVREPNGAARGSLACALLGLVIPIVGYVAARQLDQVTIVEATEATCGSAVLGAVALVLARRARRLTERTLGRVGGPGTTRAGRLLGLLSLCVGITAGLALVFYALLNLFG